MLLLLERFRVMQPPAVQIAARWNSSITLFLIAGVLTAAMLPASMFAFALARSGGPMARWVLPWVPQLLVAVLLLDLGRY